MTDEREPSGRIDAPAVAPGSGASEASDPVGDDPQRGSADSAGPPLQPVRPWLKQGANGSSRPPAPEAVGSPAPEAAGSPVPGAVPPIGPGPAPNRQWPVVDRPAGTRPDLGAHPDRGTRPDQGTRPRPAARPSPLGAGPAPSNEESVLAALQAGTGDAAELRAGAADSGGLVSVDSSASASADADAVSVAAARSLPEGRLRRARRWLFEQAPADGAEAGELAPAGSGSGDDSPGIADDATREAQDHAASDAHDDGWTAAELAALRADVEPDGDFPVVDSPIADRTVTARGELARRLAAIHDDPDYDPAALPVDGSEVRPTVAWDDLAVAVPAEVEPAVPIPATAAPEPALELEPEPEPESGSPAERRPRPRPYAGAPVHYTDEPLPEVASQRPAETIEPAAAPARGPAAATPRSEEPAAQEKLDKGGPARGRRTARWLIRTAVLVAIAVVTAVLLRAYVVSPYYIPSASMEPTLHGCSGCNNDHVLVDKLSYRMHDVHRGDVVVFHRPDTWQVPEKTLIKRVVGLPGDRLAVRDGKVYVNGLQLQESYLNADCAPMTSLSEDPGSPVRTYGPVPPGDLYVMGDNRCDSADSRAFGPVPTSDVIGRAFVIIWPLGRIHWL